MTVATESRQQAYTGDEEVLDHPVPFPFLDSSELVVRYTFEGVTEVLTEGEDYEVSGGDGEIGTVTFLWPPDDDSAITIARELDFLQPTDLATQGNYSAKTHEDTFDRLTYLLIQLKDRVEALEAVLDALNLGTGDLLIRSVEHITPADGGVEDSFPITFALPAGFTPASVSMARARNMSDPTDTLQPTPQVGAWSLGDGVVNVAHVSGLENDVTYQLDFLVVGTQA